MLKALICLMAVSSALADEPINTDRPDFADSTTPVGRRTLQIETGVTYQWDRDSRSESGPEAMLRYGLANRLELRLQSPDFISMCANGTRVNGIGDSYVGLLVQLGPIGGFDVAAIPGGFLPTGSSGFTSGEVDPDLMLTWSRALTSEWGLAGGLYFHWPTQDGKRATVVQAPFQVNHALCGHAAAFLEYVGSFPKHDDSQHLIHLGFTFRQGQNRQWDIHYGFGLNSAAPNAFVGGGYSFRF